MFIIPENKSWVIYGIRLNKENSTYRYIGLTTTRLSERFTVHKDDSKTGSSPVNRWLRKHASEGFLVEVLVEVSPGDYGTLNEEEYFWIAIHRLLLGDRLPTDRSMLNIEDGGGHSPIDEDTRAKISASLLKYYDNPDVRVSISETSKDRWTDDRKLSWSGEGNPAYGKRGESCHNYGLIRSEETRAKISKAHKGKPKVRNIATCPHCSATGNSSSMTRFHFDNCETLNPKVPFKCLHCPKESELRWYIQKYHNENCKSLREPKKLTCPHCGKTGGISLMKRYHMDNCKLAPTDRTGSASPT